MTSDETDFALMMFCPYPHFNYSANSAAFDPQITGHCSLVILPAISSRRA
jgi:hypothetical protein